MNRKKEKMLVGEGLHSLCNYTVIRCFFFFFFISSAVLQRCHNRGWTSLSSLCLLSRQLTMERSAGGDPDPLIVLWQPWPSQQEDRKQQSTACWPAHPPPPPLPNYNPYISSMHSPQHPIITPIHSDAIHALKTSSSCIIMSSMPSE